MTDKLAAFHEDLNISMTKIHAVLEHWGLGGWKEYLIVRLPDKPESFIVLAHPSDKSDFAEQLEQLHRGTYRTAYMSEVARIIEGATRRDMQKVQNYVGLLCEKLEADGERSTAERLRKIAGGNAGARIIPLTVESDAGAGLGEREDTP